MTRHPPAVAATKYPWYDIAVGQSFFVPGKRLHRFASQINHAQRRSGRRFTARGKVDGVKVWRVA